MEGGVDAILIETIFDTLNAKAAIRAAELSMQKTGRKVPLMLSVTVSDVAGPNFVGTDFGCFSGFRPACRYFLGRFELFIRCQTIETFPGTTGPACTLLY